MDRILRPTGFIIVRDKPVVIDFIKKYMPALHWVSVAVVEADPGSDPENSESVLVIRKQMWNTNDNLKYPA